MAEEKKTKTEGDKPAKKPAAKPAATKAAAQEKPAAKKAAEKKPTAKTASEKKPAAKKSADKKPADKKADGESKVAKPKAESKPKTEAKAKAEAKSKADAKASGKKADGAKKSAATKAKSDGVAAAKKKPSAREQAKAEKDDSADGPLVVRARARYVRTAPRKARLVIDHIRGRKVGDARTILQFTQRHAARDVSKVLESAIANAEHNHELNPDDLIVAAAYVDEGPTLKRWQPRARGRASQILKRTSHITVEVTEARVKNNSRKAAA